MLTRVFLTMLASAVIGLAALTPTAGAESVCGPRDKIITTLGDEFQEKRQSMGISGYSAVIELFVSIKGSWTLLTTDTKGISCLIAEGEAWQDAPLTVTGSNS